MFDTPDVNFWPQIYNQKNPILAEKSASSALRCSAMYVTPSRADMTAGDKEESHWSWVEPHSTGGVSHSKLTVDRVWGRSV